MWGIGETARIQAPYPRPPLTEAVVRRAVGKVGSTPRRPKRRRGDGTIRLAFGPEPPAGLERNWIQTIPSQGFFVMFRLYGPLEPVFDESWQLADLRRTT